MSSEEEKTGEYSLLIRCSEELWKAWKNFLTDRRFKFYSDGLRWLLEQTGYLPRPFTLRLAGEKGVKRVQTKAIPQVEFRSRIVEE